MSIRASEHQSIRAVDLALLRACREDPAEVPWRFFGFTAAESLDKAFEANGLLNDDKGTLAVLSSGALIGRASWLAVQHGPTVACRALNVGVILAPKLVAKSADPPAATNTESVKPSVNPLEADVPGKQ